jgi:hypothetical protein
MKILSEMDRRIKKFGILDEKLAQGAAVFLALIVVKYKPEILNVNVWWFVALLGICAVKPLYVFYIKK